MTGTNKEITKVCSAHIHTPSSRILRGGFVLEQSSVIKVGSHNHFDCSEKLVLLKYPGDK